jgi:hypothetical protein
MRRAENRAALTSVQEAVPGSLAGSASVYPYVRAPGGSTRARASPALLNGASVWQRTEVAGLEPSPRVRILNGIRAPLYTDLPRAAPVTRDKGLAAWCDTATSSDKRPVQSATKRTWLARLYPHRRAAVTRHSRPLKW